MFYPKRDRNPLGYLTDVTQNAFEYLDKYASTVDGYSIISVGIRSRRGILLEPKLRFAIIILIKQTTATGKKNE